MWVSAAIVMAMMTVGAFLVIAMVVTPGATAYMECQISTFDQVVGGDEDADKLLWSLHQFRS